MNKLKGIVILTCLILSALACSLFSSQTAGNENAPSGGAAPASEATVPPEPSPTSPTDQDAGGAETPAESGELPAPEAGAPAGGPAMTINLEDPDIYLQPGDVDSYRTTMAYSFVAPGSITGTINLEGATQVDPYETSLVFKTGGRAVMGSSQVFTFTQILDTQYVAYTGFGCIANSDGMQDNPYDTMLDTGGMLTGEAVFTGEEMVNGRPAYVYAIDINNIDPNDTAGLGVETITDGRVYLAQEGGYVLRLVLAGSGKNEALSGDPNLVGDIYYELNFLDFNQPVEVEIPSGCTGGGTGELEYPVPEGATGVSSFAGVIGFNTALDSSALVAYYTTEMAALGCGAPEQAGLDPAIILSFTCPTGAVQVLITEAEGDEMNVTILSGQ